MESLCLGVKSKSWVKSIGSEHEWPLLTGYSELCPPQRWPLTPTASLPPSSLPTGVCPLSTFELGLEFDISMSASLIWTKSEVLPILW